MEDYADFKEPSLSAGNTTDEEPTISLGYSLPQMSPNHLHEESEDMAVQYTNGMLQCSICLSGVSTLSCLSEYVESKAASWNPEAESQITMSVTKTEESETQTTGPINPVVTEDPGYLDTYYVPSSCFSAIDTTLSPLKFNIITGTSLTDDYDDFSLCSEELDVN